MATYDYVIVGAGSAGCVLAHRLSADPEVRVALLEAGGPDRKTEIHVPAAFGKLFKTDLDWNYTTTAQPELAGRELYWPRGKMLGGSSSMNAQMWVRGHQADYDGWADQGCKGWSYEEVLPYFQRAERRAGSNAGGVYGTTGPNWISELRDPNPTTQAFLAACAELGWERLPELNTADNTGFGPSPVIQHRGRRWSAADAYLKPIRKRRNLSVLTGCQAQRVTVVDGRADAVEYRDQAGRAEHVHASREVILSAGAIGSPQLLLLSGIGPADHLGEHRIEVHHDSPDVGANLQDHLVVAVIVHCTKPVTLVSAESRANLARFLLQRKGMLTSNVGEAVAMIRTDPELAGPDIELIFAPVPYIDHGLVAPPGHGLTIGVVLLQPQSRGRITLTSADPAQAPAIDPGYLTADEDLSTLRAGVDVAQQAFATDAMRPWVDSPLEPGPADDLAHFVREQAETLYHPVGTCRMGTDDRAVLDPELRVRGIDGLRVVDASVMPRIVRGHTHAPTVMIAERAADLISG